MIHQEILDRLNGWIDSIKGKLTDHQVSEVYDILDDYRKDNQVLKTSSRLLLYHVEDVIGLAQIESGKFTKILEQFDVKSAVEDIMSIQKLSALQKKVKMTCQFYHFPRRLDATLDYTVYSDLKRFQQVLLNLQSNSLKFSSAGGCIWIKVYYIAGTQQGIEKETHVDNFFD